MYIMYLGNLMSRGKNFARNRTFLKPILLIFVISTSLFAVITPQESFSATITHPVGAGSTTLDYRDILDTTPTLNATISIIPSTLSVGDTATITVNDFNANLDTSAIDFASAIVEMSSVTSSVALTENGTDTQIFEGTFTVTAALTATYDQEFKESARASVTVDMAAGGGSVTLSDVSAEASDGNLACEIRPVTDILKIELASGSLTDPGGADTSVTMSYANGLFDPADLPGDLDMFYKKPGAGWDKVVDHLTDLDDSSYDFAAKTLTSDPGEAVFGSKVTVGQFVLGFDVGCAGGGGGGFTRAGLVVNALAGLSALGGGGGGTPGPTSYLGAVALSDSGSETISLPQEIRDEINNRDPDSTVKANDDIYEEYDFPLSIGGKSFAVSEYASPIETQTVVPGEPTEFKLVYYSNSELAHSSLYFNLGPTRSIQGSNTQVLLYQDKPAEIIDPNGNIATATGSINNEGELKRVATFSITFSEFAEFTTSDMVNRAWSTNLNSGDIIYYDAIELAQPEIVEFTEEDIPEPEIQTLKSQHVPIWIKNNAAWWSQELIDDSDFVAGIEYLVQQEIITITETGTLETNSSDEIPKWIKNNAGWWSEDLITEKEFIDGIQWLISNGIIKVVET